MNLLTETLHALDGREVAWVGSTDGEWSMTWEEFARIADSNYDAGFGAQHVARDLVVVFTDGSWLERGEYDGSEWWADRRAPLRGASPMQPERLIGDFWPSLSDLHD